jgi:CPA2 family monovalent cation:H+ antiporter-2
VSETRTFGPFRDHVIVAGYGLPGRQLADSLRASHVPYCVIEFNHETVDRVAASGVPILPGDAADPAVLHEAGIETASVLAVAIPDDATVLRVVTAARSMNPSVKIVARCLFTSAGFEAVRRGADDAVVAEQVVARDLTASVNRLRPK